MRCEICAKIIKFPNKIAKENKMCNTCMILTERLIIISGKLRLVA